MRTAAKTKNSGKGKGKPSRGGRLTGGAMVGKASAASPSSKASATSKATRAAGAATPRRAPGAPRRSTSTASPLPAEVLLGDGSALVVAGPADLAAPAELGERVRAYAAAGVADRTRDTYAGEWRRFTAWAAEQHLDFLPADPGTVAAFLAAEADRGRKASGIELALVAISQAHRAAGHPSPREHGAVQRTRRGIRRTIGTAQTGRAPLLVADLRAMVDTLPPTREGARDRALLLIGWAGAFRRSELVGLDVADVAEVQLGAELTLRRSKVDQEGAGAIVPIPFGASASTCPARALRAWLAERGNVPGPLFISARGIRLDGRDVARLIKRVALAAGLDPSRVAGHSLRSGMATTAARAGKGERTIMAGGRWSSATTARRYIRDAGRWDDVAASGIGL